MTQRELKFRVWDNGRKEWVHGPGNEVNLFGETIVFGEILRRPDDTSVSLDELNDLVALQYSGLKDKHRKEIFDKDILSLWCQADPNDYEMKAEVFWNDEQFGWFLKCYHPSGQVSIESLAEVAGEPEFIERIGNIYTTPELVDPKMIER